MRHLGTLLAAATLIAACGDDDTRPTVTDDASTPDAGTADASTADAGDEPSGSARVTYWQDMIPLFEKHCLQCHQAGGIAPFPLDNFEDAARTANLIDYVTSHRTMPPWDATSDGTCGTFQKSLALSDAQIALISKWVSDGKQEGVPATVQVPTVETLPSATPYVTPSYQPKIAGGPLAQNDDYRCFLLDANVEAMRFITGYDVLPGSPSIVHHVVLSLVDVSAPASEPAPAGTNNGQWIKSLDDESPDQLGWPCFGIAGDGVDVLSVPVVWAPGQGVVSYPHGSGIPLAPTTKVVVQVHYNLADASQRGKTDSTTVRLQLAPKVDKVGIFQLPDALLESLYGPQPDLLQPGKKSELYSFKRSIKEMGLEQVPGLELWGVMPHMHQLGRKYQMRVKRDASQEAACGVDVQRWDFHWQRMYFYEQPFAMGADSEIEVTCDYDTSSVSEPVSPGWGTSNEMCLATLYFTAPAAALGL